MIQNLCDKIWSNPRFQDVSRQIEHAWLVRELGVSADDRIETSDISKVVQAAAILACSEAPEHRRTAFRLATWAYELFGADILPLDQVLRVVLSRLENFPSISTRLNVNDAFGLLPLSLAAEELLAVERRQITLNHKTLRLTGFQHHLWSRLVDEHHVALSAPTSAGKSFILQHYLTSRFALPGARSIIYIVPTRALISQVADDLKENLRGLGDDAPEVVTIPFDAETTLRERVVYVMTQERVQLAQSAHPDLRAEIVVVDEAQSIADGSRGILLQWVIDVLLERNRAAQVLFASPTIRNLDVFGRLFGLPAVSEVTTAEPTVAQNFLVVTVEAATSGRIAIHTANVGSTDVIGLGELSLKHTLASRVDKLVHIPAALGRGKANIIYANGAAEAEDIAAKLADLFSDRTPTEDQLALAELSEETVHPNYLLAECIKRGVAFHYSNIPTQLRRAIEAAVQIGAIDYLVCTSTLLQGVNLPAKNIFLCMPEKGRTKPLDSTDFWNLAGRAGRLRREFQGNIFLIDYGKWKTKPLDGPRALDIVPALEGSVRDQQVSLLPVIAGERPEGKVDNVALETTFVRLYLDLKRGELPKTLDRLGIPSPLAEPVWTALRKAAETISIPPAVLRRTPNISAHKQQRLGDKLRVQIESGKAAARAVIPLHPRESDAFVSYTRVLALCHEVLLELDTSKNLHRFHALLAKRWMIGMPLPQIIDAQIERRPGKPQRTTIRETLDVIEAEIRFQAVRLFGCYGELLSHALDSAGMADLISSIPALPLYLELGASDKTMISFISLGLSRVSAMKLNEVSARKDLNAAEALNWLRSRPLESLGLSPLLLAEVRAVASSR